MALETRAPEERRLARICSAERCWGAESKSSAICTRWAVGRMPSVVSLRAQSSEVPFILQHYSRVAVTRTLARRAFRHALAIPTLYFSQFWPLCRWVFGTASAQSPRPVIDRVSAGIAEMFRFGGRGRGGCRGRGAPAFVCANRGRPGALEKAVRWVNAGRAKRADREQPFGYFCAGRGTAGDAEESAKTVGASGDKHAGAEEPAEPARAGGGKRSDPEDPPRLVGPGVGEGRELILGERCGGLATRDRGADPFRASNPVGGRQLRKAPAVAPGRASAGCKPRARRQPRRPRSGFTLIELVIAIAVASVLAALAAPSFGGLRRAAGVSAATSELLSALHFARSRAALEGLPVTLCLSKDESTCARSTSAGASGWLVFVQPDATVSSVAKVSAPVLRSYRVPNDVSVHGSRAAVTFWPATRASTTSTFDVCDMTGKARGRAVVVSQTGRPRVAAEEASCAP